MSAADHRLVVPAADPQTAFTGERFVPGLPGEIALEHLHRYLAAAPLCAGRDVLDIASGQGYGSALLAQAARSVVGVDVDEPTVRRARELYRAGNLRFEAGDCIAVPLPDGSVDAVVSFETIEHITDHERFLAEVRRVLRPGGVLFISTPDREVYNRHNPAPNPYHPRELTRDEFAGLLGAAFANVRIARQRTLFASALAPERDEGRPPQFISLAADRRVSVAPQPAESVYLLAVCTDGPAVALGPSFYEGEADPHYLNSLLGGIVERDRELAWLRDQRVQAEGELAWLRDLRARADADIAWLRGQLERANPERVAEELSQLRAQVSEALRRAA
jgi:SAM-dependent methyltransferase